MDTFNLLSKLTDRTSQFADKSLFSVFISVELGKGFTHTDPDGKRKKQAFVPSPAFGFGAFTCEAYLLIVVYLETRRVIYGSQFSFVPYDHSSWHINYQLA